MSTRASDTFDAPEESTCISSGKLERWADGQFSDDVADTEPAIRPVNADLDTEEESIAASDAELHTIIPKIGSASSNTSVAPLLSSTDERSDISRSRKSAEKQRRGFEYDGDEVVYLGKSVTPVSHPSILHKMAGDPLPTRPILQGATLRAVSRECEIIIAERSAREPTNVADMRHLLRQYDDFAMLYRPTVASDNKPKTDNVVMDRDHQKSLFIARVKLIHALAVLLPNEKNATALVACHKSVRHTDHYWHQASTSVGDAQLAKWLEKTEVVHPSLTSHGRLAIHECTLDAFWQSMLTLMGEWPHLKMSAELVRLFDELRLRAAFFACYREVAPDIFDAEELSDDDSFFDDDEGEDGHERTLTIEDRMERAGDRIMGLNLAAFGLLDLEQQVMGEIKSTQSTAKRGDEPLIDNYDLGRVTRDAETGTPYMHVNMDFIDECERIFHAMMCILRASAGFVHAEDLSPVRRQACLVCRKEAKISDEQVERLYSIIDEKIDSEYNSFVESQFRDMVLNLFVEPSELEQFQEFHPQEVHTGPNCISRKRNATFTVLSSALMQPQCPIVWRQTLRDDPDHPAHALMAALALNFCMRQDANGAELEKYYASCHLLDPFPFTPTHSGAETFYTRVLLGSVHTRLQTTGTLRLRNKLMMERGARVPPEHLNYEHPIIVRSLNSHFLLYDGHVHKCDSFGRAFCQWLITMCVDSHVGGQTGTGASLHEFASRVLPDFNDRIAASQEATERKIANWNPMSKLVVEDELAPLDDNSLAGGAGSSATASRLAIYDNMTQF